MNAEDIRISILVIDAHDLVRAGLVALLGHERDIRVAGEARSDAEGLRKVRELMPDVVLMDVNMPAMDGIETIARLVREFPKVRVLVVTHLDQDEYLKRIMLSGARGVVSKSCPAEELRHAVRRVQSGELLFPKNYGPGGVAIGGDGCADGGARRITLTPRELEVFRLVANGCTNQEIATRLCISVRTVEFHRSNIIEKVGARDAISLVRFAVEHNIISIDSQALPDGE
jgi:DNA-binding NarL/FixJ family response regulator